MSETDVQSDSARREVAASFRATALKMLAPPVLIELSLVAMARIGLVREQLPWLAVAWCLAFVGLMLAWRWRDVVFKCRAMMLAWAVVFRVTLLPCQPDLSDDYYRYIWDGWLSSEGVNPYRYVPSDPALADYARQFPSEKLNSKQLYSVYPPLTQAVCAVAGAVYAKWGLSAAFVAMKAIFTVLEVVGIACLLAAARSIAGARCMAGGRGSWRAAVEGVREMKGTARREPRPPGCDNALALTALYAWNPLAILAIAGQGHGEAGLVFGIGLAAWAMTSGKAALSWAGLMLAALAKLTPLLAAPLWWKYWMQHKEGSQTATERMSWATHGEQPISAKQGWWPPGVWAAIVVLLVFIVPIWFPALPANFASSLRLYVQWFEFNGPVYSLIKAAIQGLTGYDSSKQLGPLLAIVTLMICWRIWRKPGTDVGSVFDRYALIIAAFLLLATTVHPWYALAAMVLAPLSPVLRWSWMWFSFASFATYFSYNVQGTLHDWHGLLSAFVWIGFAGIAWREHGSAIIDHELKRRGRRKAKQIAPYVQGTRILDLGCGEGYVAAALTEDSMASAEPRELLLCDVADTNRTVLPHIVYDGSRLPMADASVDTVILSLVLHHCADPAQVLREAARVSRRRLIVTESTFENRVDRVLIEVLDRLANRLRSGPMREQEQHLCFRTDGEWRAMFENAGLRVVEFRWLNRVVHKHVLFVLENSGG